MLRIYRRGEQSERGSRRPICVRDYDNVNPFVIVRGDSQRTTSPGPLFILDFK